MTDSDRQDTDGQPTGETVDVATAAGRLGVTPDAVRSRLHRGTIEGEKVDGQWRVRLPAPAGEDDHRQDATGEATGTDGPRQDTDRARQDAATVDLSPMSKLIADLARRNEDLSAAAAGWQARALRAEEELKQLQAGPPATVEAVETPEPVEISEQDAADDVPDSDAPAGIWARLARWWKG